MQGRFREMTIRRLGLRENGGEGAPITLTKTTEGVYNPITSQVEGGGEEVFEGSALRTRFKSHTVDGNLIRADDLLFYVSPVLLNGEDCPEPIRPDTLTFEGKTYSVVSSDAWDFSGIPCGWRVQARIG